MSQAACFAIDPGRAAGGALVAARPGGPIIRFDVLPPKSRVSWLQPGRLLIQRPDCADYTLDLQEALSDDGVIQ